MFSLWISLFYVAIFITPILEDDQQNLIWAQ